MMELNDRIAQTGVEMKITWTAMRKRIAASYLYMNTAMGKLVSALKERNMYDDPLIVFISDNGGGVFVGAAGNNYPLKGLEQVPSSLVALSRQPTRGTSFDDVIHIADWYATFSSLAGVAHLDYQALRANDAVQTQGLPLLAEVDGRPQMEHILAGSNGRSDPLHLSPTAVLKWPLHSLDTEEYRQELQELKKNVSDPEVIEYMAKIVVESLGSKANSCLDD